MRYVAYLILVSLVPWPGEDVFAQNINTAQNFPDPNFRTAVERFMRVTPGGEFTAAQAAEKTGRLAWCEQRDIMDMTGLEYFTGITQLNCSGNSLSHLV
ncbi:MAG: hypothetical protein ABIH23_22335 [bacterium]